MYFFKKLNLIFFKVFRQSVVNVKGFSPRYTAPEVFGKLASKNEATSIEYEIKGDVYSYAIILWQMLSKKIPWAHGIFFFFSKYFPIF